MNEQEVAKHQLVPLVTRMYRAKRDELASLKAEAQARREQVDFLWRALLSSFATWGGARGYESLKADHAAYTRLGYRALASLSSHDRHASIDDVFVKVGIRWPHKKAELLARNHEIIEGLGGVEKATAALFAAEGRGGKIAYLSGFHGIGEKYSRDIMMDAFHPDFRDVIAVDARIKRISSSLGLTFRSYEDHERFYLAVAHACGMTGWELDRLMFWNKDKILHELEGQPSCPDRGSPAACRATPQL